jgi:hypothetical protein
MSRVDESDDEAVFVACIQEVDDLVSRRLRRYPEGVIVVAICTCLVGLLGALLDDSQCTVNDVRELLRDVESNVLGTQSPADK